MNRNTESYFAELPQVDIERSTFDLSRGCLTSFDVGELIPFFCTEIYPGDTFNVKTAAVVRLQTPLTPIFSNMYMDTYYFFVPNIIIWNNWKKFMGESDPNPWSWPQVSMSVPQIQPPLGGWNTGSLADYFGLPVGKDSANDAQGNPSNTFSHLPFRAYAEIWNQWFRDQNISYSPSIPLGDATVTGLNDGGTVLNRILQMAYGGAPAPVAKYHDYFTSATPQPSKGPDIGLWGNNILDSTFERFIPVYPTAESNNTSTTDAVALKMRSATASTEKTIRGSSGANDIIWSQTGVTGYTPATTSNLWANAGQLNLTISELRLAFQLQKFYEKAALYGTRYRETIKAHFGVTTSDHRVLIPEYLGGHRFPLSVHQVENNSEGTNSFLGDLGAMSNTSDVHDDFIKSFETHGFLIGVACVRYDHQYSQGVERFWLRKNQTDYYFPVFANISNQPIYKDEICYDNGQKDKVFGYQEAWADLRYGKSIVTGQMRPGISGSLASWHLGDYYTSTPTLSDGWIYEDKSNVDRVLSVQSSVADQVMADFYVKCEATRPMPLYSIPGLVDHH